MQNELWPNGGEFVQSEDVSFRGRGRDCEFRVVVSEGVGGFRAAFVVGEELGFVLVGEDDAEFELWSSFSWDGFSDEMVCWSYVEGGALEDFRCCFYPLQFATLVEVVEVLEGYFLKSGESHWISGTQANQ